MFGDRAASRASCSSAARRGHSRARSRRRPARGSRRAPPGPGSNSSWVPRPPHSAQAPCRAVEREHARRDLRQRNPAIDAGTALRKPAIFVPRPEIEEHQPVGEAQARLECFGDAAPRGTPSPRDGRPPPRCRGACRFLQADLIAEFTRFAVDAHAHVALAAQLLQLLAILAFAIAHDWGEHLQACALTESEHSLGHLGDGLARDRLAAARAMGLARAREEQPQVVRNLGDRPDGRARVAASCLLLDRDGRREPSIESTSGLPSWSRNCRA